MTPTEHRDRALARAEAATDPRDVAVYRSVARTWERIGAAPIQWSLEPATRQLAQLQADCQQPLPRAPAESAVLRQIERTERAPVATITF